MQRRILPFRWSEERGLIKLSDGEQTVILTKKDKPSDEWHCLFKQDCYQKQPSKKRNVAWYTYVFTEADFATDVPVNND